MRRPAIECNAFTMSHAHLSYCGVSPGVEVARSSNALRGTRAARPGEAEVANSRPNERGLDNGPDVRYMLGHARSGAIERGRETEAHHEPHHPVRAPIERAARSHRRIARRREVNRQPGQRTVSVVSRDNDGEPRSPRFRGGGPGEEVRSRSARRVRRIALRRTKPDLPCLG